MHKASPIHDRHIHRAVNNILGRTFIFCIAEGVKVTVFHHACGFRCLHSYAQRLGYCLALGNYLTGKTITDHEGIAALQQHPITVRNRRHNIIPAVHIGHNFRFPKKLSGFAVITPQVCPVTACYFHIAKAAVIHTAAVTAHDDHPVILHHSRRVDPLVGTVPGSIDVQNWQQFAAFHIHQDDLVDAITATIAQNQRLTGQIILLQEFRDTGVFLSQLYRKGFPHLLTGVRIQKQDLIRFQEIITQHHQHTTLIQEGNVSVIVRLPQFLSFQVEAAQRISYRH